MTKYSIVQWSLLITGVCLLIGGITSCVDMFEKNPTSPTVQNTPTPRPTESPVATSTPIPTPRPTESPVATSTPIPTPRPTEPPSSHALADIINQFRQENGLPAIPISSQLTLVAETHVWDLETNHPDQGSCNLHSWSGQGSWTSCCYTSDHAQASCMWNKPREIAGYPGNGYEIATGYSSRDWTITPERALESWKGSPPHLDVILNRGKWTTHPWRAMGAGISEHFAVVWFGEEP